MVTLGSARQFLTRVYSDVSDKNVTFMAAGLAYNAFLSLVPLLILLFLTLALVGGGLEGRVVEAGQTYLPGPIADVLEGLLGSETSVGGASVIGLVVLVWGALKIFRGLDTAFSEIYETATENSFVDKLRDGVIVLVALVLAVVATVAVSVLFGLFTDTFPILRYVSPLVLLGGLLLAFLPMYYVFPDADLGIREVLPGAVFAAVGWAAFQVVFQMYLAFSDPGSGSFFGGVIVVVTYLYFSALVLLLGAVINAVVGEHSMGRPGGVGKAAADERTTREESLDRDELDAYLRGLNERLTARYDAPTVPGDGPPRPRDSVRLVESVAKGEDARRWEVRLTWTPAEESDRARERDASVPVGQD